MCEPRCTISQIRIMNYTRFIWEKKRLSENNSETNGGKPSPLTPVSGKFREFFFQYFKTPPLLKYFTNLSIYIIKCLKTFRNAPKVYEVSA